MSSTVKPLLDKSVLRRYSNELELEQLQSCYELLQQLIDERRQSKSEAELQRKGKRTLDDMRGLMAKAGISMSEFQAALNGL